MYGLPENETWDFLVGKTMEQLCIGELDVQLRFAGDVSISINVDPGEIAYWHTGPHVSAILGQPPKILATTLASLVGHKIVTADSAVDLASLLLTFDNQEKLAIRDTTNGYESFSICSPSKWIIV